MLMLQPFGTPSTVVSSHRTALPFLETTQHVCTWGFRLASLSAMGFRVMFASGRQAKILCPNHLCTITPPALVGTSGRSPVVAP